MPARCGSRSRRADGRWPVTRCASRGDRVRLVDHAPGGLPLVRGGGHPARRRARCCRRRLPAIGAIVRSYNALLDRAARLDDLEAFVLVHQDAEIVSAELVLDDPGNARRPRRGRGRLRRRDRGSEHRMVGGVGDAVLIHQPLRGTRRRRPARLLLEPGDAPPYARTGEVETLDGFVLVLAPWVVRNVRFDESLGAAARLRLRLLPPGARGRPRVVNADFRRSTTGCCRCSPTREWIDAHIRVAEKWDGRMPRRRRPPSRIVA